MWGGPPKPGSAAAAYYQTGPGYTPAEDGNIGGNSSDVGSAPSSSSPSANGISFSTDPNVVIADPFVVTATRGQTDLSNSGLNWNDLQRLSMPSLQNPELDYAGNKIYYSNGKFAISNQTNTANHVETDGHGGLRVVVRENTPWILSNPAIITSIYDHESTHIQDMLATDPNMAVGLPAGLVVGAENSAVRAATEINATYNQLLYLDAVLSLGSNNGWITPVQMAQVQWYRNFVQNYQDTFLNINPPHLAPPPASWNANAGPNLLGN